MFQLVLTILAALVALVVVWKLLSLVIGVAWAVLSVLVALAVVIFVIGLVRRLIGV